MKLRAYLAFLLFLAAFLGLPTIGFAEAEPKDCPAFFANLTLVKQKDPVLHIAAKTLAPEEIAAPRTQQLIAAMREMMKKKGGVGIAAPQVGESANLVIAKTSEFGELALINPKVTNLDKGTRFSLEGCLSIPGQCGIVSRQKKIKVDFFDEKGVARSIEASGFDAVVIQHEVDHLNGILYVDRNGRTARKLGGIGRLTLWKLDSDGKVLASKFVAGLNERELGVFQKQLRKNLEEDMRALAKERTAPRAFLELDEFSSRNTALSEMLDAYKILAGAPGGLEQKAALLGAWAKSDVHALYLADLLSRTELHEAKPLLARLQEISPHFDFIRLPGIRGPPFKDPAKFFVLAGSGDPVSLPTVQETIQFARLAVKYRFQPEGDLIRLQFKQGAEMKVVHTKDASTALYIAKEVEEHGAEEALKRPLAVAGKRFVSGDSAKKITFGLEVEIDFRENPKLLDAYRIESVPEQEWKALSLEQKLARTDELLERTTRKNTMPFVKTKDAPKWLPERMDAELDGNAELNGVVFDTIEETRAFVKNFTERYGSGYWQGHVVFPKEKELKGLVGYSILEGDIAQLKSLEQGYFKFLGDERRIPGRFLTHHSLGPLSETDKAKYLNMETRALKGRSIGSAGDSRVHNGPALRDDKYPGGHVGFELRQYHKRGDQLVDAMDNLSIQLHHGRDLQKLEPLNSTELVSSRLYKHFAEFGLPPSAKSKLRNFLDKVEGAVHDKYPNIAVGAAPVSERFLLPLRNWKEHPAIRASALNETDRKLLHTRIDEATRSYSQTLSNIADAHRSGRLGLDDATTQAQIAVSKWAYEARVSPILDDFEKKSMLNRGSTLADVLTRSGRIKSETIQSAKGKVLLADVPRVEKTFANGKKYDFYRMPAKQFENVANISEFKKNTVEVMFEEASPYGHIRLRVGENIYTFNFSRDAKHSPFSYAKSGSKSGYIFFVPAERIAEIENEIKQIYHNSQTYNLPPFDPNSSTMAIRGPPEKPKYKREIHSIFSLLSSNSLDAKLIEKDGRKFLVTPDNFQYPVNPARDGTICVQSLSCSTSATYVLKDFFGIDVEFMHGAKSLRDALESGNLGRRAPDAIIHYK